MEPRGPSVGSRSESHRVVYAGGFMAVLGCAIGRIRGFDGYLCEGRDRECQFGLRDVDSYGRDPVCAWRIVIGTGQWQPLGSVAARTYLFLGLSGLATGASWLCYFRALQIGDAALVAPIDKLSVVLVAIFGVAFLGERLSGLNWLGVSFIAGGAVLVAYRG